MLNVKTKGLKLITLICGFAACVAVLLGIVFASPTSTVYAAGETEIDTLGVAFRKVEVGDTLDAAFEFENATTKFLRAQTIRQRSNSYQKTDNRRRCGKKAKRLTRGAELRTN